MEFQAPNQRIRKLMPAEHKLRDIHIEFKARARYRTPSR